MPVTRFSEFVIVADLIAMDRTIADVVFKSDLHQHLRPLAGKSFANARIAGQFHPSR
jgi:N12 class adenine-specific DNA methylase